MITSPNDTVRVAVEDGICTVTIHRPDSLNALNDDVVTALIEITGALKSADDIRCVVVTGAGDHFMAGGDIKRFHSRFETSTGEAEIRAWFNMILGRVHIVVTNMQALPMPVIAAVRGAAAGVGFSFMLGCDLVIAAEGSKFTLAYIHLGTSPDGGSSWLLPRMVGMKQAMEIALLGDRFGPERALELGLINRIVPADKLDAEVAALAQKFATGPAKAYAATKRLLYAATVNDLEAQLHAESESFVGCAMSKDFREGVTAFVEKRKPAFTGQ
ncbi:MAG: enoyl-CoA hydratase-related protein [Proteobacteria bacterium]|nr:enoyl-CoA hydratase-related protein [Pseudomonadota bacterium]